MPKFITIGYGDEAGYNRTPSKYAKPLIATTRLFASPARLSVSQVVQCRSEIHPTTVYK